MTDLTDEDKMMERLLIHKNMIGWLIKELQAEGIKCQRTTGNDPNGDILLINPEDESKVQEIIRKIQHKYNS
jgi:hypothetical protein